MECRFCDGTGINDWEKQRTLIVFGKTCKEWMEIWKFAKEHGWEEKIREGV